MAKKKTTTKKPKMTKTEIYKIRYQIYRDLGYSSKEARKMRSRELDVSQIKVTKDGKVPVTSKAYKQVKAEVKVSTKLTEFKERAYTVENDTVYSRWGMLTQDRRYKDDTAKMVKMLEKQHNLSNDQAYYFLYTMTYNNLSYEKAKKELLTNKEFEMYDKNKKMRGK